MTNRFAHYAPGAAPREENRFARYAAPSVPNRAQAFVSGALDSATLGWGDEAAGVAAGVTAAATGGNYAEAYRERVNEARERLRQAQAAHPISTMAGQFAGGAALFAVPGVGQAATLGRATSGLRAAAAGRGATALAAQTALGGIGGATAGAVYGAGAGNENDRTQSARESALWGAGGGAVSVPLFQAGGRLLSTVSRPAMDAARRSFGAELRPMREGGQLGIGPRTPQQPPPVPDIDRSAVRSVDRMIGRQRSNVDALEGAIERARAAPMGRTLADVGGEQFLAKADALANMPGQTGPRAAALAEQRSRDLPGQITDALQQHLGIAQSPTEALAALQDDYARASRELYEPILSQEIAPDAARRLEPILRRLPQRVRDRAASVMDDLAAMEGLNVEDLNGAQRLHYLKMALDDAIMGLDRAEGLGAATRGGLRRLKGEFLRAIEGDPDQGLAPIIPGYREARMQWSSLADAEEALALGKKALSQRPQEVQAIMARLTPFERRHFQIAAADEAIRRVMRASSEVGARNAANALNSTEIQNVLRAVFDDPRQADAFLASLNERNALMRNAAGWTGGSQTARRLLQAGDQFGAALENAAEQTAAGNRLGAGQSILRGAYRTLRGGALERENNALGNALLNVVDDGAPESQAYTRALLRELRRIEAERAARAAAAGRDGATGAIGGGALTDDNW